MELVYSSIPRANLNCATSNSHYLRSRNYLIQYIWSRLRLLEISRGLVLLFFRLTISLFSFWWLFFSLCSWTHAITRWERQPNILGHSYVDNFIISIGYSHRYEEGNLAPQWIGGGAGVSLGNEILKVNLCLLVENSSYTQEHILWVHW